MANAYLGRLGWAGIAIEATPGAPLPPTDYLPYTALNMIGKHTPIEDISARGIRDKNYNAVYGRIQGEGSIEMNLDPTYSGYVFKMITGSEGAPSQIGTSGVYDHTFSIAETSTPLSATLTNNKGAYTEFFPYTCVKDIEIDVKDDGFGTLKANLMSQFPITNSSGTMTTVSGTYFSFKDLTVQFGATHAAALAATPMAITGANIKINQNLEAVFQVGNRQPYLFAPKELEVTGEYDLLLANQTEVNNYYNMNFQEAVFTFNGAGIGAGVTEQIVLSLYRFHISTQSLETGIANLFAVKSQFTANYSISDGKTMDIVLQNRKASAY